MTKKNSNSTVIIISSIVVLVVAVAAFLTSFQAVVYNPTIGSFAWLCAIATTFVALLAFVHVFIGYKNGRQATYRAILICYLVAILFRLLATVEVIQFSWIEIIQITSLVGIIGLCTPLFAYRTMTAKSVYICIIALTVLMAIYSFVTMASLSVYPTTKFPISIVLVSIIFIIILLKHKSTSLHN